MKKIYSLLVMGVLAGMLTACSKEDSASYESPAKIVIKNAELVFSPNGGTNTVTTNAVGTMTATTTSKWMTVEVDGSTLKLTAEKNSSLEMRAAVIDIAADGAVATLTAQQNGMIVDITVNEDYVFNADGNEDSLIVDNSNVDFDAIISVDWIQVSKTSSGYKVHVDDNTDTEMRTGNVTLSFKEYSQSFRVIQLGTFLPFTSLTTAVYTDENGAEQTKAVTVVADPSKDGAYLIQGLLAEGDVQLLSHPSNRNEFFVPSGYTPGTYSEDGATLTLRCIMSAWNKSTGKRFIPTVVSTGATASTAAYRMAFQWSSDAAGTPVLQYFTNKSLSSAYTSDGMIVCKYSSASSASAVARKGIVYYFTNLKFTK